MPPTDHDQKSESFAIVSVKKASRLFVALLVAGTILPCAGPVHAADEGELDTVGHTADGVYLDFEPVGLVELPRIFLVKDADGRWGLDAFGSTKSALNSREYVATYADEEGIVSQVTDADALSEMIYDHSHLYSELQAASGEIVVDLSVTRHLVFGILSSIIALAIFVSLANQYKRGQGRDSAPRGIFQNMFESLVVFVRDEIARPNIGHKHERFLPFLLTAFFFILISNLLGLVPYGAAATSNISVTIVLATFTFVLGQVFASKDHWRHIFSPPGVPLAVKIILVPVEFIGLFTKHAALAIRLFANMMAGSLVILTLIGLIFIVNTLFGGAAALSAAPISIALTLFISGVKLLVAFIQAYVFTMLSALFIGMAVAEHHDFEGPTPEDDQLYHDVTPTFDGDSELVRSTMITPYRQVAPAG